MPWEANDFIHTQMSLEELALYGYLASEMNLYKKVGTSISEIAIEALGISPKTIKANTKVVNEVRALLDSVLRQEDKLAPVQFEYIDLSGFTTTNHINLVIEDIPTSAKRGRLYASVGLQDIAHIVQQCTLKSFQFPIVFGLYLYLRCSLKYIPESKWKTLKTENHLQDGSRKLGRTWKSIESITTYFNHLELTSTPISVERMMQYRNLLRDVGVIYVQEQKNGTDLYSTSNEPWAWEWAKKEQVQSIQDQYNKSRAVGRAAKGLPDVKETFRGKRNHFYGDY